MHSDFSEWFIASGIELQDDVLQKRWVGVIAFEVGREEIVSLTELFFGFFDDKDIFLAAFRKNFQDADSSFRMRDNNRELSVLAGATLVKVMEEGSMKLGDLVALALVSCAAQNLRGTPFVADIPERAMKRLSYRTVNRGTFDSEDSVTEENQVEIRQLRRDINIIGEESNVLWWVFGETSRDTNQRWSECNISQASLMAGKELADLTRIPPGPAAAAALLDRVLRRANGQPGEQIAVEQAIACVALNWRLKFAKDYCPAALANLRPVSRGIEMSVEFPDGDAWVAALASTKIRQGGKIAPHLLAYQIFIECLLATVWSEVK